jgi:hypothetical protein
MTRKKQMIDKTNTLDQKGLLPSGLLKLGILLIVISFILAFFASRSIGNFATFIWIITGLFAAIGFISIIIAIIWLAVIASDNM